MRISHGILAVAVSLLAWACGSSTPTEPPGTPLASDIVRETLTGSISATGSPACSSAFQQSVDASYFNGGTGRCVEFTYTTALGGPVNARLTWADVRLDLDMVLNDTVADNYQQSMAANRCCETVQTTLRAGAKYAFVIYLRGVDAQFLANGGKFGGEMTTAFSLAVERMK